MEESDLFACPTAEAMQRVEREGDRQGSTALQGSSKDSMLHKNMYGYDAFKEFLFQFSFITNVIIYRIL